MILNDALHYNKDQFADSLMTRLLCLICDSDIEEVLKNFSLYSHSRNNNNNV